MGIDALVGPTAWLRPKLLEAIESREPMTPPPEKPAGNDWVPFDVINDGTITIDVPHSRDPIAVVVGFNASGAITNLRVGNVTMADSDHPLALLVYRTHSEDELNQYGDQYCLDHCRADCGRCGFSKCGLDKSGAISSRNAPVVTSAWRRASSSSLVQSFFFNVSFAKSPALLSKYGAPAFATLEVSIDVSALTLGVQPGDSNAVKMAIDLAWYGKQPTRMAESLWMIFAPQTGQGETGWRMDKLGRWVDPFSVAVNGSQTMHAIWSGIRQLDRVDPSA